MQFFNNTHAVRQFDTLLGNINFKISQSQLWSVGCERYDYQQDPGQFEELFASAV